MGVGARVRRAPILPNGAAVLTYPRGFEMDDRMRSDFIRQVTLRQIERDSSARTFKPEEEGQQIPRTFVQFWNDPFDMPADVRDCLSSWEPLKNQGFSVHLFGDTSARVYIGRHFGQRELAAFERCWHPAMRSDYFRLCFVLAEGGLYVDADDVLSGDGWSEVFHDGCLKVQPLCYDIQSGGMLPASLLRQPDLPTENRIFYLNNNPIAAPAHHPILRRALARATSRLLVDGPTPEIQSTTGPGNLTASLAAHANELHRHSVRPDYSLLLDWDSTARTCWDLEYRRDGRNWRNIDRR